MGYWVATFAWLATFIGLPLLIVFWFVLGRRCSPETRGDHSRDAGGDPGGETPWRGSDLLGTSPLAVISPVG